MLNSPCGAECGGYDGDQTDHAVDKSADADERQSSVHVTDGSGVHEGMVPEAASCG
jgi:hypothetical protein